MSKLKLIVANNSESSITVRLTADDIARLVARLDMKGQAEFIKSFMDNSIYMPDTVRSCHADTFDVLSDRLK